MRNQNDLQFSHLGIWMSCHNLSEGGMQWGRYEVWNILSEKPQGVYKCRHLVDHWARNHRDSLGLPDLSWPRFQIRSGGGKIQFGKSQTLVYI